MGTRILIVAAALAAFLPPRGTGGDEQGAELGAKPGSAGQERGDPDDLSEILAGLEQGLVALERLQAWDAHEMVARVAQGVREKLAASGGSPPAHLDERDHETMEIAVKVCMELERKDLAEELERFRTAHGKASGGDRDAEPPSRENAAEILGFCAHHMDEWGKADGAERLRELRDRMLRAPRDDAELEALELALHAFREADRHDGADFLERALLARRLELEGRTDPEAMHARERAPERGQLIELLVRAEDLWRTWGDEERAARISAATEHLAERMHGGGQSFGGQGDELRHRVAELEQHLHHLANALEEALAELEHVKQEIR